MTIYKNGKVVIESTRIDENESVITCNGEMLIWISNQEQDDFRLELNQVLDKYRI